MEQLLEWMEKFEDTEKVRYKGMIIGTKCQIRYEQIDFALWNEELQFY